MNDLNIVNAQIPVGKAIFKGGVSIRDGRIVRVDRVARLGDAKSTIDAEGAFLIPGLFDSYNRLEGVDEALKSIRFYVKGGFTGSILVVRTLEELRLAREAENFKFHFLLHNDAEEKLREKLREEFIYFKVESEKDLEKLSGMRCAKLFVDITEAARGISEEAFIISEIAKRCSNFKHVHFHPITVVQGVRAVNKLKKSGAHVSCGANIYNLLLSKRTKNLRRDLKVRSFTHMFLLVKSLRGGSIDALGTGHSIKHCLASSSVPVLFNLVHEEKLLLGNVIEALCVSPARIFHREKVKVDVGFRADLTMVRTGKFHVLDGIYDRSTPKNVFSGWISRVTVDGVVINGKVAYLRGEYIGN